MGYHTDYTIVASPVAEEVYEKIDKVLRTFNGYVESNGVDNGVGEWMDADDTWYDFHKHMIEVSRVFPEVHLSCMEKAKTEAIYGESTISAGNINATERALSMRPSCPAR